MDGAPLLDLEQTQLCQTSMQRCDWTKFNEYSCSSVISISVGKWNKQQLQTLQIDNAWSKKLNCINLTSRMPQHTSSEVTVTTITKTSLSLTYHCFHICSSYFLLHSTLFNLKKTLLQNGYPRGILCYNINDVLNRQKNRSAEPAPTVPKKDVILVLPFLDF